jgi:hypothetical protein
MVGQVVRSKYKVTFIKEQVDYQLGLVLCEAKTGFDMDLFKRLDTEVEMEDYASKHLTKLGRGSGRVVFALNDKQVLKISTHNIFGREQNENEVGVYTYPNTKPIVTKIYDFDSEYKWLVSEFVRVLKSEDEFKDLIGMSPKDLAYFLKNTDKAYSVYPELKNNSILKAIVELVDIGVWELELTRYEHWGKTSNGRLVVLDYGV